ncbi:hypothetical protein MKW98_023410 [Papaver atlanticum]|uniref:R3H-associated N-terminal domain-containing protein n=1 Tax=Papaver atlanticum TaxID=357466 RepID=A0AAD4SYQ0_9MAGN|nr:hypothetical protein MKW98_023410 [Papaver atlanticum]
MATSDVVLRSDEDVLLSSSMFDLTKGESMKSRGMLIEKKIDLLESLAGRVSNRRSRRWLNDRLLIELVPRLDAEEIRGLFAPPPWGDSVPLSPFCMTNVGDWDMFRNIDMDKEDTMMKSLNGSSAKRKACVDADKIAALKAWHRIDCRTREALRRSFLSELIDSFEKCIRSFIGEGGEKEILVLDVQDPFHRLLLHGVCEFYGLDSFTVTKSKEAKSPKMTKIEKKQLGSVELPNITLSSFLKMSKEGGIW